MRLISGLFLTLVVTSFQCLASLPPDRTFIVVQSQVANGQTEVRLVEWSGSGASTQHVRNVVTAQLGSAAHLTQTALLGVNQQADPILLGVDSATHELFVVRSRQNYPVWRPPLRARAITEFLNNTALVAGPDNALFTIDAAGNDSPFAPKNLVNLTYGEIRKMQSLGSDRIAVLTDSHLLVLEHGPGLAPRIASSVILNRITNAGQMVYRAHDLAAGPTSAWILLETSPNGTRANSVQKFMLVDFVNQKLITSIQPVASQGDLQLLDMDPVTEEALVRRGPDYVRLFKTGVEATQALSVFNPIYLNQPAGAAVHVDHVRSASAVPMRGPVALPSPLAGASAQSVSVVGPAPNRDRTADPRTAADFRALMDKELVRIRARLQQTTLERFVEELNATSSLRYYFQTLEPEELKALGLKRQMYWIRVIPGRELELVNVDAIVGRLETGRARELSAACATRLTKP